MFLAKLGDQTCTDLCTTGPDLTFMKSTANGRSEPMLLKNSVTRKSAQKFGMSFLRRAELQTLFARTQFHRKKF
jgi:hypothetical protein